MVQPNARGVYSFPRAVATGHHKHGGPRGRDLFSHSLKDQGSNSRYWWDLILLEALREQSLHASLPASTTSVSTMPRSYPLRLCHLTSV